MQASSELIEACRDPYVLWLFCNLRRDDRFSTFVKDPEALKVYAAEEEQRLVEMKEEANVLTQEMVVLNRLTSPTWRKAHHLKDKTLPEMIERLARIIATDSIMFPVIYSDGLGSERIRVILMRCYLTFSQ